MWIGSAAFEGIGLSKSGSCVILLSDTVVNSIRVYYRRNWRFSYLYFTTNRYNILSTRAAKSGKSSSAAPAFCLRLNWFLQFKE